MLERESAWRKAKGFREVVSPARRVTVVVIDVMRHEQGHEQGQRVCNTSRNEGVTPILD